MSNHLRDDNECQNCGHTVEEVYCTRCGQKNTETRQSFGHLVAHFAEDLTHYDGAFWKTIKHLLFRPAKLTKEYLEGKRQTYVPPVKLYIFISFVTFFIFAMLPTRNERTTPDITTGEQTILPSTIDINIAGHHFSSVEELNAFLESGQVDELPLSQYLIFKVVYPLTTKNLDIYDILKAYFSVLPKVLFLYMPIFALWLWLFHGKRRWYFFDHGIFTLHYFSFLLLTVAIVTLLIKILSLLGANIDSDLSFYIILPVLLYMFFYFFRAHRRMYGEKRWVSRLKGLILFFINITFITVLLTLAFLYAMTIIH